MNTFRSLLRLIGPLWRAISLAILMGFITVFSGTALIITSAYLISLAALQPTIEALQIAIVGVRFFGLSRGVFRYLERLTSHDATFKILADLRVWFYQKMESASMTEFQERRKSELLEGVINDIEHLQDFFIRIISPPVIAILMTTFMLLFYRAFSPQLALAYLASTFLLAILLPYFVLLQSARLQESIQQGRSNLYQMYLESIQGLGDLLVLNGIRYAFAAFENKAAQYQEDQKRMNRRVAFQEFLSTLFNHGGVAFILIFIISIFEENNLDAIWLAGIVLGLQASHEAYFPLALSARQWPAINHSYQRLMELTDLEKNKPSSNTYVTQKEFSTLKFDAVSFHYPSSRQGVAEASFELNRGDSMVIVGPSGGGKSTLLNLCLNMIQPDEGQVLINDQNIQNIHPDALWKNFAYIEQHTHLFQGTLRDNLLLANPDKSDEDLITICNHVGLSEFIASLPRELNTQIGEGGLMLSGGERQRIAIARALLQDAAFILCDEPTANLDKKNADTIMKLLMQLQTSAGILIITHQVEYLDLFNHIMVLEAGKFLESGSYHELINNEGSIIHQMVNFKNKKLAT